MVYGAVLRSATACTKAVVHGRWMVQALLSGHWHNAHIHIPREYQSIGNIACLGKKLIPRFSYIRHHEGSSSLCSEGKRCGFPTGMPQRVSWVPIY